MLAGQLRDRVSLLRQTKTKTPTGQVRTGTWEKVATIYAQFTMLSAKETLQAQAQGVQLTARLKVRHRTDIDHTMRIEHKGILYDIIGEPVSDHVTGNQWLTLNLEKAKNNL